MTHADCAIIGAGPAGLAASIQLMRSGREVITLERSTPGGLIREANLIENYPGFPEGIKGGKLADLMVAQAERTGVNIIRDEITRIERSGDLFEVRSNSSLYASTTVIMATGTRPSFTEIHGSAECIPLLNSINPLPKSLSGSRIIVVGGGDIAFDYALNVVERGGEAVILMRSLEPKAIRILMKRAEESGRITIRSGVSVEGIRECDNGLTINLSDRSAVRGDRILIACGREPENDLIPDPLPEGMWLAGDLKNGKYRQVSISVGDGIRAAMEADDYLGGFL